MCVCVCVCVCMCAAALLCLLACCAGPLPPPNPQWINSSLLNPRGWPCPPSIETLPYRLCGPHGEPDSASRGAVTSGRRSGGHLRWDLPRDRLARGGVASGDGRCCCCPAERGGFRTSAVLGWVAGSSLGAGLRRSRRRRGQRECWARRQQRRGSSSSSGATAAEQQQRRVSSGAAAAERARRWVGGWVGWSI